MAAVSLPAPRSHRTPASTAREKLFITAGLMALHTPPLTLFFTGVRKQDWVAFGIVYLLSIWALGGVTHRYFSHRAFQTSRVFQFAMALLAGAFLGDPVEFAGKHRLHHKNSDTDDDPHSPRHGLWHCWIGNLLDDGYTTEEKLEAVPDLTKFPELMWLHRYWLATGLAAAAIVYAIGGYTMFALAYCLNVVLRVHLLASVNYFCHRGGVVDGDASRNSLWLAIVFLGEGWHRNHHRYPGAARSGFRWYEVDALYYIIRALEWVGLVWNVRSAPEQSN